MSQPSVKNNNAFFGKKKAKQNAEIIEIVFNQKNSQHLVY